MEIYAPEYYEKFKCIADKCKHSCCVDWEIDIDEKTHEKYKALESETGKIILSSIECDESGAHFALDAKGRCKNLDGSGLCRIISELGEEYLCDICRLHPRFFNRVGGRIEVGLGFACEEAVRLALTDTQAARLVKIGENDEKAERDFSDFDVLSARESVMTFIEREEKSLFEKLSALEKKYSVKTDFKTDAEWMDYLLSLEILDTEWMRILDKTKASSTKNNLEKHEPKLEAFFKYLVFRHTGIAESEASFSSRLAFCILCAKLVKIILERDDSLTEARIFDTVRLFSSEIEYSEQNTEELIFELEASAI